jgi:hypothetical protein
MRLAAGGLVLGALGLGACGTESASDFSASRQELTTTPAEAAPPSCSEPNSAACLDAALATGKLGFDTGARILRILGAVTGPGLDEKLAGVQGQLETIAQGVAALQTQVSDLQASVDGYHVDSIKIYVWGRLSLLNNFQNDAVRTRQLSDLVLSGTVIRYTNDIAFSLTNPVLYQDGSDATRGWHTPMYAGPALLLGSAAFATAVEIDASLNMYAWSAGYTYARDLRTYAIRLRTVSQYATEWATANTSLSLKYLDPNQYTFVQITRPCPTGMIPVSCGRYADRGNVCKCRYPDWELRFKGRVQRTLRANLAGTCNAPTQQPGDSTTTVRTTPNPCTGYATYKAEFDKGAAEFATKIGAQAYVEAADLIEAYANRNSPPSP